MKVNGIDARIYDAKQLNVEVQPPAVTVNYEWLTGAIVPTEFETDVAMGHLKLCVYFRGKNRNDITRMMSQFMSNLTKSCDLELDGFKGKYRGFLKADDFEETVSKKRQKLNLEFDGYFYDDEVTVVIDSVSKDTIETIGSRSAPCIVEVYARATLTNFKIKGLTEDDILIKSLTAGKSITIDGVTGIVTMDGENAFANVDMWQFPKLEVGEKELSFTSTHAKVTIRYTPMWI